MAFRQKYGLDLGPVREHRVNGLSGDLMNLLGSTTKAVQTYNEVGVTAAKLEFNSMYRDSVAELDELIAFDKDIKQDDVEAKSAVLSRMEDIKSSYSKKLSEFSSHTAAYEEFASSSSSALHVINSAYSSRIADSLRTATQIKQFNGTASSFSGTGNKTTLAQFENEKTAMTAVYGTEADADDKTRKLLGQGYMPSVYNAAASLDKLEILNGTTTSREGLTLSSREKTADFINNKILFNPEIAELKVVKNELGVDTFFVDGPLNESDKSRIVAMADQYMGYANQASGSSSDILLSATVENVQDLMTGWDMRDSGKTINGIDSAISALKKTEEFMAPEHDDKYRLKFAKLETDSEAAKRKMSFMSTVYNGRDISSVSAMMAQGIPYSVQSVQNRVGIIDAPPLTTYLGTVEANTILNGWLKEADTMYANGNFSDAVVLADNAARFKEGGNPIVRQVVKDIKHGNIIVKNKEQIDSMYAAIARSDDKTDLAEVQQILSRLEYNKDGSIIKESLDVARTAAINVNAQGKSVLTKVAKEVGDVWFTDNTMRNIDVQNILIDIAKLYPNENLTDDSEQNVQRIAGLVKEHSVLIDYDGGENANIYNKTNLNGDQLTVAMEAILEGLKSGDGRFTSRGIKEGEISGSFTPSTFVMEYGADFNSAVFVMYDGDGRRLRKSRMFSMDGKLDTSVSKLYWNKFSEESKRDDNIDFTKGAL